MAAPMSASAAIAPYDLWSKLPGDLLGVIYGKICSPLDRVRFAAVCRSWGAVTSWQRPAAPAFPWLIFSQQRDDGTAERVYCPVDGALLRVPLPPETAGKQLVGFHDGGWIAATTPAINYFGGPSLVVVNIFSGVEAPLSARQRTTPTVLKMVFSEAPTSKRCILAAIFSPRALAVCRVGCPQHDWWRMTRYKYRFNDIALCHGKLYGLHYDTLVIFDIRMTKRGWPVITATYELSVTELNNTPWNRNRLVYIFNHGDKLLMALRAQWSPEQGLIFKVYEVVSTNDSTPDKYAWAEVTTLDSHALFLSARCSKAVYVPTGRCGGIEGNHIYFHYAPLLTESDSIYDDSPLATCENGEHLYRREVKKASCPNGITSVGYYVTGRRHGLTWLLPPDF